MREDEFRTWLEAEGLSDGTISTQMAKVRKLDRVFGDLDALNAEGQLDELEARLRSGVELPDELGGPGERNHLPTSLRYYRKFLGREGDPSLRRAHMDLIARLTPAEIELTMDDCDAAGADAFLRQYGYVRPSNWVVRPSNGERYPAKATVGIAVGKLPGQIPLSASEYFGGFGESQSFTRLRELGYEVVGREQNGMAGDHLQKQSVEQAMDEYDTEGQAAFLTRYERGMQGTRYFVRRGDKIYPSKAIANAAYVIQFGEQGPYGGTAARRQLTKLGYVITDRAGRTLSGEELASELGDALVPKPTNLILYGPPGTGKTWRTAEEAVRLCDGSAPQDRNELMERYRELVDARRIDFVTFHQNYSYEEFVEGLRPVTTGGTEGDGEGGGAGFRLEPQRGIFREICSMAENARQNAGRTGGFDLSGRKFFKMSLGRAGIEDHIYDAAIEGNYAVLGWGGDVDWSDPRFDTWTEILARWQQDHPEATGNDPNVVQMWPFRSGMKSGDLIIVSAGNTHFRAIGEVTGPYSYEPTDTREYNHRRHVRWLLVPDDPLPVEMIYGKKFMMQSCYQLKDPLVNKEALSGLLPGEGSRNGAADQFVLIIDEINRANISKVFGELITLIESDKRKGRGNALSLRLPYSRETFSVPANLHILGTMNTADRSIALLDTALRRRFIFREIAPDLSLIPESVDGVPLRQVLKTINDRIEYLIDREHRIGHAFFLGEGGKDRPAIDTTMRDKIIPLLQEYFFEDWGRVAAVLGERPEKGGSFLDCRKLKDPTGQDGEIRQSWSVRPVFAVDAYDRLIGKPLTWPVDSQEDEDLEEADA